MLRKLSSDVETASCTAVPNPKKLNKSNAKLLFLQLLMCGTGEYSISDFKAHHIVNGNSREFRRVLGWFWAAVGNFSQTEMARLLQFTTGCSQLPPGGFQELSPRFQITAAPTFGNLPTAHTW